MSHLLCSGRSWIPAAKVSLEASCRLCLWQRGCCLQKDSICAFGSEDAAFDRIAPDGSLGNNRDHRQHRACLYPDSPSARRSSSHARGRAISCKSSNHPVAGPRWRSKTHLWVTARTTRSTALWAGPQMRPRWCACRATAPAAGSTSATCRTCAATSGRT